MPTYLYGVHPTLETLKAAPERVEHVYIGQGPSNASVLRITEEAERHRIPVEKLSKERLARMADGGVHQGVVVRVAEFAYLDLEELLAKVSSSTQNALLMVLDGIEDPHNLGALIRSLYAMGGQGMVIPKDRAAGVTAAVVKASAGATAHLPIAMVTNLSRAISQIKEAGIWVVAADVNGDRHPEAVDFQEPTALVIGNEGQGIRRVILEKSDFRVQIPMVGSFGSLNASVSGAVLLYEASRQRRRIISNKTNDIS